MNTWYIKEVDYPKWLANIVLVPKGEGKWRLCIDFIDLNKACLNDSYPLPWIDALIDGITGCLLISFLDCNMPHRAIGRSEITFLDGPTRTCQGSPIPGVPQVKHA